MGQLLILVVIGSVLIPGAGAQSVADAAQKERARKQQQPSSTTPKLYTNDEIDTGRHDASPTATPLSSKTVKPANSSAQGSKTDKKWEQASVQWKEKILRQKQTVKVLQDQVDKAQASLHPASTAGLYSNVTPPSYRQQQRQNQLDNQQQRLATEKKKLDDMQEAARKLGYGSAIFDPS